eukprot:COSAG01_NODE_8806_length_2653_cov_3.282302_3_plen_113_part_00
MRERTTYIHTYIQHTPLVVCSSLCLFPAQITELLMRSHGSACMLQRCSPRRGASWWLWRQVEPATFAYSSLTVMHVNASHVTLAVVYEGTDRARGVTGGLLWTTVSDFLPRV